jgi:thioredoxin-like negative regulator of GroEL
MLERLLLVVALVGAGILIYRLYTQRHLQRVAAAPKDALLDGLREGVPTIVYFTTPHCMPCKTQQMPALQTLQAEMGESLQVVRVDATEQPEAAERWGVFSVPTTFILDPNGQARDVNYGFADAAKLRRQLQTAS